MTSTYTRRIVPIDGKQVQAHPEGTTPFKPPFGKLKVKPVVTNLHQRRWKEREQEKSKTIKKK